MIITEDVMWCCWSVLHYPVTVNGEEGVQQPLKQKLNQTKNDFVPSLCAETWHFLLLYSLISYHEMKSRNLLYYFDSCVLYVCVEVRWSSWCWRSSTWRRLWGAWELDARTWRISVSSTAACTSEWRTGILNTHAVILNTHLHRNKKIFTSCNYD